MCAVVQGVEGNDRPWVHAPRGDRVVVLIPAASTGRLVPPGTERGGDGSASWPCELIPTARHLASLGTERGGSASRPCELIASLAASTGRLVPLGTERGGGAS